MTPANMSYVSQMALMRQKAAREGMDVLGILKDYRTALTRIQQSEGTTSSFAAQQYVAEHQTWDLNWPEITFPGKDPREPGALKGNTSAKPAPPSQLLDQKRPSQSTVKPSSRSRAKALKSLNAPSYPQTSAGRQSSKKRSRSKHSRTEDQSSAPSISPAQPICGNCGESGHGIRICTRGVDEHGFVNGCPRCNKLSHSYADCPDKNDEEDFDFLVWRRNGRPPIRWNKDFREIVPKNLSMDTVRPQTAQFAITRRSHGLVQGVTEVIFDPSWLTPDTVGSQIHPLDVPGVPQATQSSIMELDDQISLHIGQINQPQIQPELYPVSAACPSTITNSISMADILGVKSLLAILKRSEARNLSIGHAEQTTAGPTFRNKDSASHILSSRDVPFKTAVAPMMDGRSRNMGPASLDWARKADAASRTLDTFGNGIGGMDGPMESRYQMSRPSSFLTPNSANMASITYSERQRQEFNLPPSPVRNEIPVSDRPPSTSNSPLPTGPMTIPQMLYRNTKQVTQASSESVCSNCKMPGHELKDCEEPCGLCDRARHTAGECTFRLR